MTKSITITFEVPVYKDRSQNPKSYIIKKLESNQIDDKTFRVRNTYSHLGSVYIKQIVLRDDNTLTDITNEYVKEDTKGNKKDNLNGIIRRIFADYGVKW